MRLLKAFGAGVVGAVLAVLVFVLVEAAAFAWMVAREQGGGSGGIGFVSVNLNWVFLAAVFGFAVGVWWKLRGRPA